MSKLKKKKINVAFFDAGLYNWPKNDVNVF